MPELEAILVTDFRYLSGVQGYNVRVPAIKDRKLFDNVIACMKNLLWDLRICEHKDKAQFSLYGYDPSPGLKTFILFTWPGQYIESGYHIKLWIRLFKAWDRLGVKYDNTVEGKIKILEHWFALWADYSKFHKKFSVQPGQEMFFFTGPVLVNEDKLAVAESEEGSSQS
jgi:hypothetical protein